MLFALSESGMHDFPRAGGAPMLVRKTYVQVLMTRTSTFFNKTIGEVILLLSSLVDTDLELVGGRDRRGKKRFLLKKLKKRIF